MSDAKNVSVQVGPGLFGLMFLVFLTLKLCGIIGWSWWWVTAPLWGPIALVLGFMTLFTVGLGITVLIAAAFSKTKK